MVIAQIKSSPSLFGYLAYALYIVYKKNKPMKKLIIIPALLILLFGCKKEDITLKKFTVTASVGVWEASTQSYVAAPDSFKYEFYSDYHSSTPFETLYTGTDGKCKIELDGGKEFYVKCYAPQGYSYEDNLRTGFLHSSRLMKGNKYLPGDFITTFIIN